MRYLATLLLFSAVIGCRGGSSNETSRAASEEEAANSNSNSSGALVVSTPFAKQDRSLGKLFQNVSPESIGITFRHQWKPADQHQAILLKTGFTGGGVCLGDYDGDGLCDVYFTSPHGGNRLFRNLGGFKFEDKTNEQKVACGESWNTGATFVDLNNDAHLDLVVNAYDSPNHVFLNDGKGNLRSADMRSMGLSKSGANVKLIFADYDNDGDLDAYLVTNRLEPKSPVRVRYLGSKGNYRVAPEFEELVGVINLPSGRQQFTKAGQFDRLYKNQFSETGVLRFRDVTKEAGLTGNFHGLDATWWDFNSDGAPDIYVANDFTDPDQLLRNNGDGTFTDVTLASLPHTPWFAMGCAVGDFNNDTRLDLMATDMSGTSHYREKMAMGSMDAVAWFLDTAEPRQYMRNSLYINNGTDRFFEMAHMSGLASSDWTWSVKVADLDNDGWEDVFVTNGFTRDYLNSDFNESLKKQGKEKKSLAWYDAPELKEQNLLFRNQGDLKFRNVTKQWGLNGKSISFGSAWSDLDNDGDLDLIVNNFDGAPSVYRNQASGANRISIALRGAKKSSNSHGVGAVITVKTKRSTQTRYLQPENGYMSSNETRVTFGLGDETEIEKVTIRWPSGVTQKLDQLAVNHSHVITESAAGKQILEREQDQPLYVESDLLAAAVHRERPFDDFALQPLLPNKMSQLGPGMASGDIDGDGDIDFVLGGAADQPATLLIRNGDTFESKPIAAFENHRSFEDLGVLIFDADSDGDQDLFFASGSVEHGSNETLLLDRLYRNESTANETKFVYDENAVPKLASSSGVVTAADFDRDGDLDLYVGGRVVPGKYPTAPASRILRNDSGIFVDATKLWANGLESTGMVTSAICSDYNNDGWIDLLITHEYGSIAVYRNEEGTLRDVSKHVGTASLLGWWNGIAAADVDHDGDIDFAVSNLGFKYEIPSLTSKTSTPLLRRFRSYRSQANC